MAVDSVTAARWAATDGARADETAEVLRSLMEHPGWAILTTQARQEWAIRERQGRKDALKAEDALALNLLRQITAAQEAVEWVLTWPKDELARRLRQGSSPGLSDQVEMDLREQSRRGRL